MAGKLLLVTILCLMGGSALGEDILEGTYNVTAFCTAVKIGTQLGSLESCQKYYVCQSTGPVVAECQTGYSYDYKKSTCALSSQVDCYYGVAEPCAGKNGTWVPNTAVCGGYYYCDNGVGKAGSCPPNQIFNSVKVACDWGSCQSNLGDSDEIVLTSLCDVAPPNQYFGDTKDCATWNFCVSNSSGVFLQTGKCPTANKQDVYNAATQQCTYNTTSVCTRVTGVPLSSASTSCSTDGEKQASATVCGTYSVCTKGKWVQQSCSTGYYYDVLQKICVTRQLATPEPGCNRCQYSDKQFVNAVNSENCSSYYYCNSNRDATLLSCPESYFFNEAVGACKSDDEMEAYVKNNGACYGSSLTTTSDTTDDGATTVDE
ncbi:peritrophin-48 [Drosophila biarmipes]|uniref:peritrophin-48 n=1 Tax=Drosophila biarmipes TaxID=125945 RepID=UPI0007E762A6|nr:peritrophin-48 [Drosophila biarmipes]